jgi:hypothetical protein
MLTAQTVADSYKEVATKTKALLDTLSITTLHVIEVEQFGSDKWLILVVYTT